MIIKQSIELDMTAYIGKSVSIMISLSLKLLFYSI